MNKRSNNNHPNLKNWEVPNGHIPPVFKDPVFVEEYRRRKQQQRESSIPQREETGLFAGIDQWRPLLNNHNISHKQKEPDQDTFSEEIEEREEYLKKPGLVSKIGNATVETCKAFYKERPKTATLIAVGLTAMAMYKIAEGEIKDRTLNASFSSPLYSTKISSLDQEFTPTDPSEEYTLITESGMIIDLPQDYAIRTEDYKNVVFTSPEDNIGTPHTAIATAGEDLQFILNGPVYKSESGRIITRIENFTQTADGKPTHIKTEVDNDGWVAVDQTGNNAFQGGTYGNDDVKR